VFFLGFDISQEYLLVICALMCYVYNSICLSCAISDGSNTRDVRMQACLIQQVTVPPFLFLWIISASYTHVLIELLEQRIMDHASRDHEGVGMAHETPSSKKPVSVFPDGNEAVLVRKN